MLIKSTNDWKQDFCIVLKANLSFDVTGRIYTFKPCDLSMNKLLGICVKYTEKMNKFNLSILIFGKENYCSINGFFCEFEKICLSVNLVCNGKIDCLDSSDEMNCKIEQKFHCSTNKNENEVVNSNLVCNFHPDCSDQSDELFCCKKNKTINFLLLG